MLNGRVVLVTGGGTGTGRDITLSLGGMGAAVSVVDGPIDSRGAADGAFAEAAGSARVDAVVHALVDPDALVTRLLAHTDEPEWGRSCEGVLRTALWCAQAAHGVLAEHGGRLVFVTPTIGLTGAIGLAPYATAVEGMRSLAKSAARQWRDRGITVNCVAPPVERMEAGSEVASVVGVLLTDPARYLTGQTVVVDGGVVMAP